MTIEEEIKKAHTILDQYIQNQGLRKTKERYVLLDFIYRKKEHFTAPSLVTEIKDHFYLSKSTVYYNLELFEKAGLIIRHHFNSDVEYEKITRATTHHHRICIECGQIKEFTDKKLQKVINAKKFTAFDVHYSAVYLYGYCKKCAKKHKEKAPSKKR